MTNEKLVEMKNIHKSYGDVQALDGVDLSLRYKEIVGLVGDNGAGKTTLVNILNGVTEPDKGEIYYEDKKRMFSNPKEARDLGIETIHQDRMLVDDLTIWENFFLGKEVTKKVGFFNFLNEETMKKKVTELLDSLGVGVMSVGKKVSELSGGQKQAVAITRAMNFGRDLLIMDEPTASLSLKETERVLDYISGIKDQGYSGILISHLSRHVYPASDRFVILDAGEKIGEAKKDEITRKELEEIIVSGRM